MLSYFSGVRSLYNGTSGREAQISWTIPSPQANWNQFLACEEGAEDGTSDYSAFVEIIALLLWSFWNLESAHEIFVEASK